MGYNGITIKTGEIIDKISGWRPSSPSYPRVQVFGNSPKKMETQIITKLVGIYCSAFLGVL